ncbi:MAG: hypothetical protein U0K19_04860 [Bifidobacteriaceae bacterium]|nr:hypothetical protein [Bifidobacteriaceae bacterium]
MSGINFNFNRGADPLLGSGPDYSAHLAELEQAQRAIEQQKQSILKLAQNTQNPEATPTGQTPSPTPIWDQIDTLTDNMTAAEFQTMQADPSYQKSLGELMEYVAAVQLQLIRPRIEASPEGKKLLEQHLTTVKFLRKAAADNVDKRLADFEDYTKNYSHMSWEEYLKTKGGQKK